MQEDLQNYYKQVALNFAKIRIKFGLTQEEFAEQIGYRRETVNRIECGKERPTLKMLFKIAAIFYIPPEEFFKEITPPQS